MIVTFDNLVDSNGDPITVETDLSEEEVEKVVKLAAASGQKDAQRLKEMLASWTCEK